MQQDYLFLGNSHTVNIDKGAEAFQVTVEDRTYTVNAEVVSEYLLSLLIDGRSLLVHTARDESGRIISLQGVPFHLADPSEEYSAAGGGGGKGGDGVIATPMPGKIVEVLVKEGDAVENGQALIIVESMKMQNTLTSDVKGVVKKVHFADGEQANFGDPLIEIEVDADG